MRKSTAAFVAGAVFLAGTAGVIRFVVLPGQERVQSSTNTTMDYAGSASFLDMKAVAAGNLEQAFAKDVPFTATEQYKTVAINGGEALMSDATTISGPAAAALGNQQALWSVDRTSLQPAAIPAGSGALAHTGLAIGFPVHPAAADAQWWDSATQTAGTAKYVTTEEHGGRSTYLFTVDINGAVKDPGLLSKFPASVPSTLLTALASTMPTSQQQLLASAMPAGTPVVTVPLTYTVDTKESMWIDTVTGETIDATQTQAVTAQMTTPAGAVPLVPVLTVDLKMPPAAVSAAADKASSDAGKILWLGTATPIALAILALALLAAAIWTIRKGAEGGKRETAREAATEK
ncbi:DUF3068 domain-containing protein [Actinospica durhamensis]|uniref:DUF3068 domain-containing protein n=1 Tax=Actinospica durhamensis TaxID=1508375 RepID=A0A941IUF3_9ACTN|nr:porin PorA family protein [Actinospica durhamensis]MBR7837388.1 DUF3068 domain-containing protein [Actinospica durhamensis]